MHLWQSLRCLHTARFTKEIFFSLKFIIENACCSA
jgi:hypothetical protein